MKWTVRIGVVVVILSVVLGCLGFMVPGDLLFALFFGWMFYLGRVVPQIQLNWNGVANVLVCLAGFAVGLHLLLSSLARKTARGRADDVRDHFISGEFLPRTTWPVRWSAAAVGITLLMFVSGMAAAGFAHQAGWLITGTGPFLTGDYGAFGAARRAQSVNNLKQIGLGFNTYYNRNGRFPAGCTTDKEGEILHSWTALLLPFLEQQSLFDRINFTLPWYDPANQVVFKEKIFPFLHPALGDSTEPDHDGYWPIHYASNLHVIGGSLPMTIDKVKDGAAQTILAGEAADRYFPWGKPGNWRDPALGLNSNPKGFGGPLPGGAILLFMDGSARFIKNTVDPKVLRALGTPDGGEAVDPDKY